MGVTMIKAATNQNPMLSTSLSTHATIDEAVDIDVLTSFESGEIDGGPDLVVELIDLYLDHAPQQLRAMRNALGFRDAPSLRAAAHSLKGSSSSLGAFRIAAFCDELEASANQLLSQSTNTLLILVEQEFERVSLALTAERRKRMSAKDGNQ